MPLPPSKLRRCDQCGQRLPKHRVRRNQKTRIASCDVCKPPETLREYLNKDVRRKILFSARSNASIQGIPFGLKVEDIPTPKYCIYLGLELDYSLKSRKAKRPANSPSIYKIIPALGYVKGNIQIISAMANRMKSNASIEQLLTFARNILTVHG